MTSPLVLVPKEKLVTSTNSFSLAPVRMEACTAAPYDTTSSGLTESQILRAPNMSDSRALTCAQTTLRQLYLEIATYYSLQEADPFMGILSESWQSRSPCGQPPSISFGRRCNFTAAHNFHGVDLAFHTQIRQMIFRPCRSSL